MPVLGPSTRRPPRVMRIASANSAGPRVTLTRPPANTRRSPPTVKRAPGLNRRSSTRKPSSPRAPRRSSSTPIRRSRNCPRVTAPRNSAQGRRGARSSSKGSVVSRSSSGVGNHASPPSAESGSAVAWLAPSRAAASAAAHLADVAIKGMPAANTKHRCLENGASRVRRRMIAEGPGGNNAAMDRRDRARRAPRNDATNPTAQAISVEVTSPIEYNTSRRFRVVVAVGERMSQTSSMRGLPEATCPARAGLPSDVPPCLACPSPRSALEIGHRFESTFFPHQSIDPEGAPPCDVVLLR